MFVIKKLAHVGEKIRRDYKEELRKNSFEHEKYINSILHVWIYAVYMLGVGNVYYNRSACYKLQYMSFVWS